MTIRVPLLLATALVSVEAHAQCAPQLLSPNVPYTTALSPAPVRFVPASGTYVALGLRSEAGAQHDLGVFQSAAAAPACVSNPLAASSTAGGVEVAVGDYRPGRNAIGGRYGLGTRTAGGGSGTFEWESSARVLFAGAQPESVSTRPPVLDLYQAFLEGGSTYTLNLESSAPNLRALVFRNPGANPYWAGRNAPSMIATLEARTLFTAPASDDYAIVVVNDDGAPGTYTFWVELCQDADSLVSTVAAPVTYPYRDVLPVVNPYWQGVAVRPEAGSDWNVALYDTARGAPEPICFEGELARSERTQGVDFVVGDHSYGPVRPFYTRQWRASGTGGGVVEWDAGADEIAVGDTLAPIVRATGPGDVIEVWDALLQPGQTYTVLFSAQGAASLRWFLFANPTQGPGGAQWFGRDQAVLKATGNALFTPTTAGWHGLAVVNENGEEGTYSLAIAGIAYVDVGDPAAAPRTALGAIAPNPVRTHASIGWTLARAARVRVDVVDVAGRVVARLDAGAQAAGPGAIAWDGRALGGGRAAAGVYFARLLVDGATVGAGRLVLLR